MKAKSRYYTVIFVIGAVGYCLIELLWRGRTHPSMALAGGLSFCLISVIQAKLKPLKFIYRCITSGFGITTIELAFGSIFNLWLKQSVWDYTAVPFNFLGQVCLLYTVLWSLLSAPLLIFAGLLKERFPTKQKVRQD